MSERDPTSPGGAGDAGPGANGALRRWRWPLILSGPIVILLIVAYFVLTSGRIESTDNAYVQIAKAPVAASIGGRVTDIYVRENQFVRKGQALFRLDSRDLVAAEQAAEAELAAAELQVRADRAAYQQQLATVAGAQSALSHAVRETSRARELTVAGVGSRQQADQAAQTAQQARESLAAARQGAAQALASLGGRADLPIAENPMVMRAKAQLEKARLNVSYTTVTAPSDGIVTRVEQLPVGSYINASQTVFWLLTGRPWLEANFKESQLTHMKVGQPATIRIDAYPDAKLKGHVASFSPGTGQIFSPLPAQNATGNWVKVVQRLPVRIEFDDPPPGVAASAGLSAEVKVRVRGQNREG